jgi:ferredoxin
MDTKITFLPEHQICSAEVGQSILEVALANDVAVDHACGGVCACLD